MPTLNTLQKAKILIHIHNKRRSDKKGTIAILPICVGFMFFAAFSINRHAPHTKLVSDKGKAMQKQLFYTCSGEHIIIGNHIKRKVVAISIVRFNKSIYHVWQ